MEGFSDSHTRQSTSVRTKAARQKEAELPDYKNVSIQAKTWIQDRPVGRAFVIILPTRGCAWALSDSGGCTMCGFLEDTYQGASKIQATQMHFEEAWKTLPDLPPKTIKIFNSGSFFDEREIPKWLQQNILAKIEATIGVEQVVVESRPEFINHELLTAVDQVLLTKTLTIALGLETSNDTVRRDCINKGFNVKEFERAVELIAEYGFRKKVYLLLKPPFLTEAEAISDCVSSALYVEGLGVEEVSINPVNVQNKTFLQELWTKRSYRPPWLWSVLWTVQQVVDQTSNLDVLCEPVGAGTPRGAHNCGKCDKELLAEMRNNTPKDWHMLRHVKCTCLDVWHAIVDDESYSLSWNLIKRAYAPIK